MTSLKDIEDVLDEQFPKGKCKERGNALVLYAHFKMKMDELIKDEIEWLEDKWVFGMAGIFDLRINKLKKELENVPIQ